MWRDRVREWEMIWLEDEKRRCDANANANAMKWDFSCSGAKSNKVGPK